MPKIKAIFLREKRCCIFPLGDDRFLIEATLKDDIHDVQVEVEVLHPSLEIVAARSEIRNGPFTNVCNMTHPNMEKLVGMKVSRGFTLEARSAIGGTGGCHRISELVVEVAQAAYQIHFIRFFAGLPKQVRERDDVPVERWRMVNKAVPGMRNTCFTYSDEREDTIEKLADPLHLRDQDLPSRHTNGADTAHGEKSEG